MAEIKLQADDTRIATIKFESGAGANKDIVLSKAGGNQASIGIDQTWQDVTASRSAGVTYTNTTSRPIFVLAYRSSYTGANSTFYLNGVLVAQSATTSAFADNFFVSVIIPVGGTYRYGGTIGAFMELR